MMMMTMRMALETMMIMLTSNRRKTSDSGKPTFPLKKRYLSKFVMSDITTKDDFTGNWSLNERIQLKSYFRLGNTGFLRM